MAGEMVTLKGKDGSFAAYLAKPAGGKGPGVVCIQEIFGVNDWMRAIADDFAAAGFVALVPDLFWRIEPGIQINGEGEADFAKAFGLYGKFNPDTGIADVQTAITHLRKLPGVSGKVGTTGYCLGGFLAYLSACRTDADANVGYYGVGIDSKLDEAKNIKKPLMLHIATKDKFVTPDAQQKVRDGLKKNPHVTIHDYPEDHAFARKGGHSYVKAAADLANTRTLDFFKKHLG
jgi:carboxymethylenebutenolidase